MAIHSSWRSSHLTTDGWWGLPLKGVALWHLMQKQKYVTSYYFQMPKSVPTLTTLNSEEASKEKISGVRRKKAGSSKLLARQMGRLKVIRNKTLKDLS
jgi:hypothetical protein